MSENKDAEMKKQEREQIVELGSDITKSSKGSNLHPHHHRSGGGAHDRPGNGEDHQI